MIPAAAFNNHAASWLFPHSRCRSYPTAVSPHVLHFAYQLPVGFANFAQLHPLSDSGITAIRGSWEWTARTSRYLPKTSRAVQFIYPISSLNLLEQPNCLKLLISAVDLTRMAGAEHVSMRTGAKYAIKGAVKPGDQSLLMTLLNLFFTFSPRRN